MHLRFQLPTEVLPLTIEHARLSILINAPSRRVTIAGREDARLVELRQVESPLDPIRIEIAERRLLRLDPEGGLHFQVTIGDLLKGGQQGPVPLQLSEKWIIRYINLEISGQTAAD
jgi:hypothetical protein